MTQTTSPFQIQLFLSKTAPFSQLGSEALQQLARQCQLLRYRMGQAIVVHERLPTQVVMIYQGEARLLGYDRRNQTPVSLQLIGPGDSVGWVGLVRGVPCETAIASTEVIGLTLPAASFLALVAQPQFATAFRDRSGLSEVVDLLGAELERRADGTSNLKELALKVYPETTILHLPPGKTSQGQLDPSQVWLVSGGNLDGLPVGSRVDVSEPLVVKGSDPVRLLGFHESALVPTAPLQTPPTSLEMVPYAPEELPPAPEEAPTQGKKYPYVRGRGPLDAASACFQMLSQYFNVPFRRDVVRRVLQNQQQRTGNISLQTCGGVAELLGLRAQLATVPAIAMSRLETPALIQWQDSFAILYKASQQELVLGIPEVGIRRQKPASFIEEWGESGQVVLLQATKHTPQQRFGLGWFLPSLKRHRKVLIEVFIASFFVQLFALANPLMVQVIIDKVLVQNSIATLNVLGTFLVVVAIFEALLTSLRTHLFVDTTNRIDMTLGSEVIEHLFRLPLRYFERRPVGELATRVNELENIRSFLTGTALTVVLDAIFSVIYIVVMVIYSWLLTLVALATIPLFVILTVIFSPVVRRQARAKAERNAETQSYLVEVVSGIQTVKAQNIELRSRWAWQERYARYISAGFQTISTSTTAGSISNFLNKLSGLLLLWVGAFLVLQGQLTLGQLIAFRIIAGYTTSPLLRLVQLWQNFQETALSLERLSDILNHPQEVSEADRRNIPMPVIQGAVKCEDVSFRFANSGPSQLNHVNLSFPAGTFIGIVGQSGSGKSTLMKLFPRLYDLDSGRILLDGYDISKVELYSLRRQIGMVMQDSLLFEGTVQENIALTNPDATSEEIIAAAQTAFAHDFIMTLPNGYNTLVGERGSALSGGQRQRITIARTVLQNPRLLILDEATSALDYHAERQVCTNLAVAFRDRTLFFITHRLSTIQNADVILYMDQGTIVEQGTHAELMSKKGSYYCLYQQQGAQS